MIIAFVVGAMFAALIAQGGRDHGSTTATGAGTGSTGAGSRSGYGAGGNGAAGGDSSVDGGAPGATGGSLDAASSGPGASDPGAAAATGNTSAPGRTAAATSGDNGGATAPGVTASSITLGILGGSSEALRPVCPRCGQGGGQTDQQIAAAMLKLWHQQGKVPVNGRDVKFEITASQDLAAESARAACRDLAGRKPFAVVTAPGTEPASYQCLAGEFHIPTVDGVSSTDQDLQQMPLYFTQGAALRKEYANGVAWAEANGLLKGQTIGLYSPADSSTQQLQQYINLFRQELRNSGYKIAVDYQYQGEGQSDDAVAVQQMMSNKVTVMFVVGTFTEPSGFQNAASRAGYHPKYPIIDTAFAFNDAVADVGYNPAEEDGNVGMALHWFDFARRKPATPSNNPAAADCLNAYMDETKTVLDVYDDTAKIAYILEICSDLQLVLDGIKNAGPKLTPGSWVAGMEQIGPIQTGLYQQVSFRPGKHAGLDVFSTATFNKARWQPENLYWRNSKWTQWVK